MKEKITNLIANSISVKEKILNDEKATATIQEMATLCINALKAGKKLMIAGNGGSAADSQHIAGELINRFRFDREPLPAIALSTDTSVLTAIGNDVSFDDIFLRQVKALGMEGDVFIGISTSGSSRNLLKALEECRKKKIKRIGLTGAKGDKLAELCDVAFKVPSEETPRIQECHILIAHILCFLIEEAIFKKS
jgi:D-sedoheptulose 7-phosphate isomerase